jgi:hypothetical protein
MLDEDEADFVQTGSRWKQMQAEELRKEVMGFALWMMVGPPHREIPRTWI